MILPFASYASSQRSPLSDACKCRCFVVDRIRSKVAGSLDQQDEFNKSIVPVELLANQSAVLCVGWQRAADWM